MDYIDNEKVDTFGPYVDTPPPTTPPSLAFLEEISFGGSMLSVRLVWARGQVLDQVFIEDSIAEELRKNGLEQLNKELTK